VRKILKKEKEETKKHDKPRRFSSRERSQDTRESDTEKKAKAKNRYHRPDRLGFHRDRSQEKERSDRFVSHEPRADHDITRKAENRAQDREKLDRQKKKIYASR